MAALVRGTGGRVLGRMLSSASTATTRPCPHTRTIANATAGTNCGSSTSILTASGQKLLQHGGKSISSAGSLVQMKPNNFGRRAFSATSAGSSHDGAGENKSESSDSKSRKYEHEEDDYEGQDTQSADKRVGNPIAWANPMAGPTLDDHSSAKWTNVYPIGAALILLGCLYSRRKNLKKQEEEEELLGGSGVDFNVAGGIGSVGGSRPSSMELGRFSPPPRM
ncbi:unnamed protein product [Amoebophrya sp. A120]|nr:unnamed protein product [Amoebophrya sp. A120]|eukprot:GSA120T00025013001.1